MKNIAKFVGDDALIVPQKLRKNLRRNGDYMKKLFLIATGGTIASQENGEGLEPSISPEEMLSYVSVNNCSVDCVELIKIDSTNVTPSHWLKIGECIRTNYDNYDGFVITHGTDTLSYTAAALSYLIQNSKKPIVITGSQKPIDAENTDARKNLEDSIAFALSQYGGVSVVFGGYAISGVRAKKMRTKGFDAFQSVNYPYLAKIENGEIEPISEPPKYENTMFYTSLNGNVALVTLTPGMPCGIIKNTGECCDGIVISSYGAGGIPDLYLDAVKEIAEKGKTVVIGTQCVFDGTSLDTYKVGRAAKKLCLAQSGDMTAEHTLIKLMWCLAQTDNHEKVKELMEKDFIN